jgi:hydroxyacylglutathione hydrolase
MRLPTGVIRHESILWEGSSALLIEGSDAIAVDPGILTDEVERLRASAVTAGATVRDILVTHADWDHLAGLSAFPDATVWMAPLAAARIGSGEADRELAGDASSFGIPAGVTARVDRELEPGTATQVGRFAVESMTLPGHTGDGTGYRVRSHGVLVVGDYLSSYEPPWIKFSSAAFRMTLAALVDILERDPPEIVIPGHGPAHSAADALQVARDDLAYLHAIRAAVLETLAAGGSREDAAVRGLTIDLPRGVGEDAETSHRENVERHLDELVARA